MSAPRPHPLRMAELLPELQLLQTEEIPSPTCLSPSQGHPQKSACEITFPESVKKVSQSHSTNHTYPARQPLVQIEPDRHNFQDQKTPPRHCVQPNPYRPQSGCRYRVPMKAATPRSSGKRSTPLKMRSGSKNTFTRRTPVSAARPAFKNSLFTPEKHNQNVYSLAADPTMNKHIQKEIIFAAPFPKPTHVANHEDRLNQDISFENMSMEKINSSINRSNHVQNNVEVSTPHSSHFSSNSILKECRENIVTPHKTTQNDKKYETPSQFMSSNKNKTPLFPMRQIPAYGSHYKLVSKDSSRSLFSVREKENSPLHPEFNNKFMFGANIENNILNIPSSHKKDINLDNSPLFSEFSNKFMLKTNTESKIVNAPKNHNNIDNIDSSNLMVNKNHNFHESNSIKPLDNVQGNVKSADSLHNQHTKYKHLNDNVPISPQNNVHQKISPPALQIPHKISPDILNKPLEYNNRFNHQDKLSTDNVKSNENKVHVANKYQQQVPSDPVKKELELDLNDLVGSPQLDFIMSKNGTNDGKSGKQFKTITIKGKNYTVLGKLGSGGSSDVLKVMDIKDSSMYAVKCVNLAVDQLIAESYINEIRLLQRLQGSDRVITMHNYEFIKQQKILYVILEMGDVDLSSLLKSYGRKEKSLPYPILVGYWTEMLTAVNHIHQNGIIHSDLKPANFLLVHGRLKLIDFGIASSINMDATSVMKESTMGTFNYISPEAIAVNNGGNARAKISYKSDVWSLGCILYSMLYGRTPFSQIKHMYAKMAALTNPNQKIEYPPLKDVPPVLMKALRWCLTYDVKQRPSVQELIDLPYINCTAMKSSTSESNDDIPLSTIAKIKSALTDTEWRIVAKVLDDARK